MELLGTGGGAAPAATRDLSLRSKHVHSVIFDMDGTRIDTAGFHGLACCGFAYDEERDAGSAGTGLPGGGRLSRFQGLR